MKRTAGAAFPGAAAVFQPNKAAMLDPKAYFAQWQQQANATGQVPLPAPLPGAPSSAAAVPVAAPAAEKSAIQVEIEGLSAVKCAALVKEKGDKFTTSVAIVALSVMATKSSYKLREELFKYPHVKRLCTRVQELVKRPPTGFTLDTLSLACWSLNQFPDEALGEEKAHTFGATAAFLARLPPASWNVDQAVRVLYVLARSDSILEHKTLVTKVVAELVADQGRRVKQLSHESLVHSLHAVARARRHIKQGDLQTVHCELNDEALFKYASQRVAAELDTFDVKLLADLIHTHNEVGIKDEGLFKVIGTRIIAKQKELNEKSMGQVIKAYTRFMLPLKEEQQGFRTMAIVAKGDFIRPSDKPKRTGKRTYDHPQALYDKTPVHSRG